MDEPAYSEYITALSTASLLSSIEASSILFLSPFYEQKCHILCKSFDVNLNEILVLIIHVIHGSNLRCTFPHRHQRVCVITVSEWRRLQRPGEQIPVCLRGRLPRNAM